VALSEIRASCHSSFYVCNFSLTFRPKQGATQTIKTFGLLEKKENNKRFSLNADLAMYFRLKLFDLDILGIQANAGFVTVQWQQKLTVDTKPALNVPSPRKSLIEFFSNVPVNFFVVCGKKNSTYYIANLHSNQI
jgi:hypothetical protein